MSSPATIVVDGHVYHVLPDLASAPRRLTVTVRDDRGHEWTYDEPAWRPLGYCLVDRRFFLWSARRLIVFGEDKSQPELVENDEDILYVCIGWRDGIDGRQAAGTNRLQSLRDPIPLNTCERDPDFFKLLNRGVNLDVGELIDSEMPCLTPNGFVLVNPFLMTRQFLRGF